MATRKKATPARSTRGRQGGAQAAPIALPRLQGTANDIVGLLLVVLAVAMAVALLLPSSAPVTRLTGEALVLMFGSGAMLFPAALLAFALTFFVGDEEPITGRIAFGLCLIICAALSIVSITCPGAPNDNGVVLAHEILRARGGYVGGGIAWALLRTVGREVGIVVLVGSIIAGIVICGFSISDAVGRFRAGVASARASLAEAGEERRARRAERRERRRAEAALEDYEDAYDDEYGFDMGAYDGYEPQQVSEPRTTYIGSRTSTVLTRGIAGGATDATADSEPVEHGTSLFGQAVTNLLSRRHKADDLEDDYYEDYEDYEDEFGDVVEAKPQVSQTPQTLRRGRDVPQPPARHGGVPETLRVAAEATALLDEEAAAPAEETIPEFLLPKEGRKPKARRKPTKRTGTRRKKEPKATAEETPAPASAEPQKISDANVRVQATTSRPGDNDDSYTLPPLSMLSSNPQSAQSASSKAELDQTMAKLQGTLREFGLTSRVVDYISGPLVTTFRIEMGEGERVNKIRNLEDDIALTLAAEKVRIFAPIAGTSFVGIEIPNKTRQNVHLGDVLPYAKGGPLEVAVGRDSSGRPVIADIAKMPHMLVAGTTGSGKSVMINSMIMSLLMRSTPKQVRLIMVDPKRVEFKGYNGIPHLYVPVVTEPRQAASALQWAVSEMERRLKVFERAGARNITVYNDMCVNGKLAELDNPPEPMPYLVIVIDELSALMMVAGKDVEASIVRIAQLARAAGIHLVIATQRPSANVVTGLIKSNIDSRIALKVSSGIDSRVILDETGADRLLGNGDMLFKDRGLAAKRVLGCFTPDPEIEAVVDFIREQGEPDYHEEILSAVVPGQPGGGGAGGIDDEDDPLIWEAAQIVVESQLGSTSGLQRRLKVGYARAGRIMDMLESKGVVGPSAGSKPREVLLDEDALEDLRAQEAKYREV